MKRHGSRPGTGLILVDPNVRGLADALGLPQPRHRRDVRVDAPTLALCRQFFCPRCAPSEYARLSARHRADRPALLEEVPC